MTLGNLNVSLLCEEFSVSRTTIYRWRTAGKIPEPDFVIGDKAYWNRSNLYTYLQNNQSH